MAPRSQSSDKLAVGTRLVQQSVNAYRNPKAKLEEWRRKRPYQNSDKNSQLALDSLSSPASEGVLEVEKTQEMDGLTKNQGNFPVVNALPPTPPDSRPQSLSLPSTSDSEWTFQDIADFVSIEGGEKKLDIRFQDANTAELKLGHIIYIQDEDSRLHNRVMVVIRQKRIQAYFTCVAMCRHFVEFWHLNQHWRVQSITWNDTPRNDLAEIRQQKTIEVNLRPHCRNGGDVELALYPGTTIDLWSLWHVPANVKVMVVGSTTAASLQALGREVAEMTLRSLPGCKDLSLLRQHRAAFEHEDEMFRSETQLRSKESSNQAVDSDVLTDLKGATGFHMASLVGSQSSAQRSTGRPSSASALGGSITSTGATLENIGLVAWPSRTDTKPSHGIIFDASSSSSSDATIVKQSVSVDADPHRGLDLTDQVSPPAPEHEQSKLHLDVLALRINADDEEVALHHSDLEHKLIQFVPARNTQLRMQDVPRIGAVSRKTIETRSNVTGQQRTAVSSIESSKRNLESIEEAEQAEDSCTDHGESSTEVRTDARRDDLGLQMKLYRKFIQQFPEVAGASANQKAERTKVLWLIREATLELRFLSSQADHPIAQVHAESRRGIDMDKTEGLVARDSIDTLKQQEMDLRANLGTLTPNTIDADGLPKRMSKEPSIVHEPNDITRSSINIRSAALNSSDADGEQTPESACTAVGDNDSLGHLCHLLGDYISESTRSGSINLEAGEPSEHNHQHSFQHDQLHDSVGRYFNNDNKLANNGKTCNPGTSHIGSPSASRSSSSSKNKSTSRTSSAKRLNCSGGDGDSDGPQKHRRLLEKMHIDDQTEQQMILCIHHPECLGKNPSVSEWLRKLYVHHNVFICGNCWSEFNSRSDFDDHKRAKCTKLCVCANSMVDPLTVGFGEPHEPCRSCASSAKRSQYLYVCNKAKATPYDFELSKAEHHNNEKPKRDQELVKAAHAVARENVELKTEIVSLKDQMQLLNASKEFDTWLLKEQRLIIMQFQESCKDTPASLTERVKNLGLDTTYHCAPSSGVQIPIPSKANAPAANLVDSMTATMQHPTASRPDFSAMQSTRLFDPTSKAPIPNTQQFRGQQGALAIEENELFEDYSLVDFNGGDAGVANEFQSFERL